MRILFVLCSLAATCLAQAAPTQLNELWQLPTAAHMPQATIPDAQHRPFLYVALKTGGVGIFAWPKASIAPRLVATVPKQDLDGLDAMQLAIREDRLYVALGDFFSASGSKAGVAVVDISRPQMPRVTASWISEEVLKGSAAIAVDDQHVFLGMMSAGVGIFSWQGDKLEHLGTFQPEVNFPRPNPGKVQHPNARGFAINGNHLFVAYDAGGIRVLDVADSSHPREIGRYVNAGMAAKQQAYNNLVISDNTLYAAIDYAGLEILDIRQPAKIRQIGWWNPWAADTLKNMWFNSPGHTNQLAFDPSRNLVYLSAGGSDLLVVDVHAPRQPRLVQTFGGPDDPRGTWGVTLTDNAIILTMLQAVVPFRGNWNGITAVAR